MIINKYSWPSFTISGQTILTVIIVDSKVPLMTQFVIVKYGVVGNHYSFIAIILTQTITSVKGV